MTPTETRILSILQEKMSLTRRDQAVEAARAISEVVHVQSEEWTEPDENENIDVPDHLMPLFNKIGFQMRLHTISGKNELLSIARMVRAAEMFFTTPLNREKS